jgi:hypothetical protein
LYGTYSLLEDSAFLLEDEGGFPLEAGMTDDEEDAALTEEEDAAFTYDEEDDALTDDDETAF